MSLPAFSAIIGSYVPNHGDIGPSGPYNTWVNKINIRKNACNSWVTCTDTPDDIRDEKFIGCDNGCSECDIPFCNALADVYEYTRRLESSDNRRLTGGTANGWPSKLQEKIDAGLGKPINYWIYQFRRNYDGNVIEEGLMRKELPQCPGGCEGTNMAELEACPHSNFCGALSRYMAAQITLIDPDECAGDDLVPEHCTRLAGVKRMTLTANEWKDELMSAYQETTLSDSQKACLAASCDQEECEQAWGKCCPSTQDKC